MARIALPDYRRNRVGAVTTEGDAVLNADKVRALGIDGSGVKVGVISDGANNIADAQATGDLPPEVAVFGNCTPEQPGDCNEGTALLEIVHDIAPGAALGFCAPATSLEFIQCIDTLGSNFGAHILVDDLGFNGEPYFEDGAVAMATAAAIARGITFVSAAGNDALNHYEAEFRGVEYAGLPTPAHDFGARGGTASDATLDFAILPGTTARIFMQWGDPYAGSSNDYDLYVLNHAETDVLASSVEIQDGDDPPLEVALVTNDLTTPIEAKILVLNNSATVRPIEIFIDDGLPREYNVPTGSIFGHPAVPGVLAVGAISALDAGNDQIQPTSSLGPSVVLFPAPEIRTKPDITAIDVVSVTGVGGFPTPFPGTSAAAPHVAGVAALVKQANPVFSAAQITAAITNTAVDLGAPGIDNVYGAGRIDALAAVQAAAPVSTKDNEVIANGGGAFTPITTLILLLRLLLAKKRLITAQLNRTGNRTPVYRIGVHCRCVDPDQRPRHPPSPSTG